MIKKVKVGSIRIIMLLAALLFSADASAQSGEKLLKDLTGWEVPGLESVKIKGVEIGPNYFSANLPPVAGGRVKPKIVGYRASGQKKYNIGIVLEKFYLSDFTPVVKDTPLNDLAFENLTLISIAKENANHSTAIPKALQADLGRSPIKKPAGTALVAKSKLIGAARDLLDKLGLPSKTFRLSGKIDPGIFAGKIKGDSLKEEFLKRLDITLPLPTPKPSWRPGFLSFGKSTLRIKGGGQSVAMTVNTGLNIRAGKTLKFSPVTVTYDENKKYLSFLGVLANGSASLPVPLPNSAISNLKFAARITDSSSEYQLGGLFKLNNKNHNFIADITGKSEADYALKLDGQFSLGDFGVKNLPGLENISISSPVISKSHSSGDIKIGKIDATFVMYKPAGKQKPNIALLHNSLALSDLVSAAKNTPLDDLILQKTAFMITPKENAGINSGLPNLVANHIGAKELELKAGVNIKAVTELIGEAGKIMSGLHLPTKNLPLTGTFDASIFKQPKSLGKAFLANLDLIIPIKKLNIPGAPNLLTLSNASLKIRGFSDGLGVKLASKAVVKVANKTFTFDDTLIAIADLGGGKSYELTGVSTNNWQKALGVDWLTLKDIGLDIKIGKTKSLSLFGVTSLGKIHNLTARINLDVAGGKVDDFGIGLTGADIPLTAIPGLNSLPNIKDFALRDLIVSKREIAGTTVTKKIKALNGLRTVIFQIGNHWNFAMLRKNLSLTEIIPVKGAAKSVFQKIKLNDAAIVISAAGINNPLSDLPTAARQAMEKIYGDDVSDRLHLTNGLNMVSAIDPSHFGKGLAALSGGGGKPIAFSGGIGGLFGGLPSIDIAANIPKINMPASMKFLELPKELQTSFFVRLEEEVASFGVELATLLEMKTKYQKVKFDTTIDFEADSSGGLTIDVQGKTDSVWKNALGIKGFNLDPGTRMEFKVNATSEIDITFVAKSHIGDHEVDVTSSVGVIDGAVDKGAFEGYVSELGLHDLIALTNAVAKAGGGKPTDSKKVANIKMTKVDFAFASPGVDVPEMQLVGGGMRLAGNLWFMLKEKPLGKFKAQIDGTGISISGKMSDFKVGPIGIKNTSVDMAASISPPNPPYFKINGEADLFKAKLGAEYSAALNNVSFHTFLNDAPLLVIDINAEIGTQKLSFSPAALAKFDMSLKAELKSDIPKWLRTDGKKFVTKAFNSVAGEIKKIESDLENAEKKVKTLDGKIKAARAQVEKDKRKNDNSLKAAEKKVTSAQNSVNRLNRDIKSLKGKIHGCHQAKRICTWYDVIKRKCTHHKYVPDLGKIAKCEANNTRYGTLVAGKEVALKTSQGALTTANGVLEGLRKGNKFNTTDLDPRVSSLIVSRETAVEALHLAEAAAKGALKATDKMKSALDIFSKSNAFVLKKGLIQGSLSGMVKGKPVVVGMDYSILGKSYHNAFAFSATDPAFTADQLGTIAVHMVIKMIESSHGKDPATKTLLRLLQEAYLAMHTASEKKLHAAMKANRLE